MKNKKIISIVVIGVLGLLVKYMTGNDTESYNSRISNETEQTQTNNGIENPSESSADRRGSEFDFLPTSTTGQIIRHNGYSLSYSEKHEQAEWVSYSLRGKDLKYVKRKRPYFEIDQKIKTKAASWKNYKKSGYDRGHLCPAADRQFQTDLYVETFLTSNISPQKHDFNAGIWNRLEQKTRYWAKKYNNLYIATGGILTNQNMETIGSEKVSVPNYFYKILLDYTKPEIKAIAFLMPHKESNSPLYEYVVSIDEIEKLTGIDFFHNLPDDIEDKLEKSNSYKEWSFR